MLASTGDSTKLPQHDMAEDQLGQKSVSTAAQLSIYDATGKKCEFGDIFKEHKSIIVFIRKYSSSCSSCSRLSLFVISGHFFCGVCTHMSFSISLLFGTNLSLRAVR